MKKRVLLLSAIFLTTSIMAQKTLTVVKVDLDSDGVMDIVSEKELNKDNNRLEIKLSHSHSTLKFDEILPAIVTADGQDIPCSAETFNIFKVVKNGNRRLIEIRMQLSDLGSCSRESHQTIQVSYENNELVVSELSGGFASYSSGDPSPSTEYRATLNRAHWASTFEYKSLYDVRSDYGVTAKLLLPNGGCELTLSGFNKSHGAIPECVLVLLEQLEAVEVIDYDF